MSWPCTGSADRIAVDLPPALAKRFDSLVAREVAALLWCSTKRCPITSLVHAEIQYLHSYLSDPSNPWEVLIGHVVPRHPNYHSAGDASQTGGGAINDSLGFWFDCRSGVPVFCRGSSQSQASRLRPHQLLEFLALLLQIVACVCLFSRPRTI
jgi:hypothetical protein